MFLLILSMCTFASGLDIDCHPDAGATMAVCQRRGCIWKITQTPRSPWCTFDHSDDPNAMAGYEIVDSARVVQSSRDIVAKMKRRPTPSLFGNDYDRASLEVQYVTEDIVRVIIADLPPTARRAQHEDLYANLRTLRASSSNATQNYLYDVEIDEKPFGIHVIRRATNTSVLDSRKMPGFTFAKQYLQMTFRVPSQYVYGLGECTHEKLKHDFDYWQWALFTRDQPPGYGQDNLYGYHPFYLSMEDDQGLAHGVFFFNTHATNVALQPDPNNPKGGIMTWRTIGGVFEYFVFLGPTSDDVLRQYTSLIGRPNMPPYWALGFTLSRYGYKNMDHVQRVFDRNRAASIPQDVQTVDIDYMSALMDFTVDKVNFGNLSAFVDRLHSQYNMKFVVIVDPAIASRPTTDYPPLKDGLSMKVFVKDNRTGKPLEGRVWPGPTYYPDFTNPVTLNWWTKALQKFHDELKFDGLWIDMNEPSSFVTGSVTDCAQNSYTNPPYKPVTYGNINDRTLCMDADQYAGKHYELHSLYGYTEAINTYRALQAIFPTKRPFVLSRSTAAGSGHYTNHWTGDNYSYWAHLKLSIVSILEFNIFGIPMMGADICGYAGEANEELCVRWMQTGAFYPYYRNHNELHVKQEQDPAAWSPNAVDAIRNAMRLRYSLLPYLYTLFFRAQVNGTAVARPLFFEFPTDLHTRLIIDQFLWGTGLMIAPVMDPNTMQRVVYFPKGRWYNYLQLEEMQQPQSARNLTVPMPLNTTGVFIRGGSVIPTQAPEVTTFRSRQNAFSLRVALDENYAACGSLYWDDGESDDVLHTGRYTSLLFQATDQQQQGSLNVTVQVSGYQIGPKLEAVTVMGMRGKPTQVDIDGQQIPGGQIIYDENRKVMVLSGLNVTFDENAEIIWKF